MRRLLALLFFTITLLLIASVPAGATEAETIELVNVKRGTTEATEGEVLPLVTVKIDANKLDADAFIVNGRTVVPMRAIFEALGATIKWDADTRTVTATKGETVIELTIDKPDALVRGKQTTLAVPPMLINGRTFVPLRFISEALGNEIAFDNETRTVTVKTLPECNLPAGQEHKGYIQPGGERWGLCGSPHIVTGRFDVEGKDSPVLTIEAGALVEFADEGFITVGQSAPGGLLVNGTPDKPVTFTAASAGAQAGYWRGIKFYDQTMRDTATIENARIQYAGDSTNSSGAIYAGGGDKLVEVLLKNVGITDSLFAGVSLEGMARLKDGSGGLTISGTKSTDGRGGFPIVTGVFGSNKLPNGTYTGNELNAINLATGSARDTVSQNTTWRNLGVPYASSVTVKVEGTASPTLKIEPGVVTLWKQGTGLDVGEGGPGTLVADAWANPEGGTWPIDVKALETGSDLANSAILTGAGCEPCGKNHAIVFGGWAAGSRGSWSGIRFLENAGVGSKLDGVVVGWGGDEINLDYDTGVYVGGTGSSPVKIQLANSLIFGSAHYGVGLYGNSAAFAAGSTGNYVTLNAVPVRVSPEAVGSMEKGFATIGDNDHDWISVWSSYSSDSVAKTATWRDHGVPYYFETSAEIGGKDRPAVTIEAGTKLVFAADKGLTVGSYSGPGSLVAVGTSAKPIVFTSELNRKGSWQGLAFTSKAGDGNRLEFASIENPKNGVSLEADLGAFINKTTIKNASQTAIYRGYDPGGTSFLQGQGNVFENNALDENK